MRLNSGSQNRLYNRTEGISYSSIPGDRIEDVDILYQYIKSFGQHPRMFRYDGGVLISTFAGENRLFGQPTLNQAWNLVKRSLEEIVPVCCPPPFDF